MQQNQYLYTDEPSFRGVWNEIFQFYFRGVLSFPVGFTFFEPGSVTDNRKPFRSLLFFVNETKQRRDHVQNRLFEIVPM